MQSIQPKWYLCYVVAYKDKYNLFVHGENRFFLADRPEEYPETHETRLEMAESLFDEKFSRILGEESELIDVVIGLPSNDHSTIPVVDGFSILLVTLNTDQDRNDDRARRMRGYLTKHYQDCKTVVEEIRSKWLTKQQLEALAPMMSSQFQTVIAHLPTL